MTDPNDPVYQAWKNTLSQDELEMVERGDDMPAGMESPFWGVTVMREMIAFRDEIRDEIADLRRPLWRQALAPVAVAGAFVAGLLGLNPRELGG